MPRVLCRSKNATPSARFFARYMAMSALEINDTSQLRAGNVRNIVFAARIHQ